MSKPAAKVVLGTGAKGDPENPKLTAAELAAAAPAAPPAASPITRSAPSWKAPDE